MKQPTDNRTMQDAYTGHLHGDLEPPTKRIMVGVPMTGLLRSEWVIARYGQIIPCNWGQTDAIQWIATDAPLNFMVADARNYIVNAVVQQGFEWLFFIDHDVILPPDTIIRINRWMMKETYPMVSGLYFTKSVPSEPLVYRGRGTSYYDKWKFGDVVEVDGHGMGCTLISAKLLKLIWEDSEEYEYKGNKVRRVFETPTRTWFDPESLSWYTHTGTEDLEFMTKVIKGGYLAKAGWKDLQKKKYPFVVDTNIFCKHIEFNGQQFPSLGEDQEFRK